MCAISSGIIKPPDGQCPVSTDNKYRTMRSGYDGMNDYKNFLILFLMTACLFSGIPAQVNGEDTETSEKTAETEEQKFMRLRGLEQEKETDRAKLRKFANKLLAIPRYTVDALFLTTGFGAYLFDDVESRFVERIEDFLYLYQRKLSWYPAVLYSSGAGLSYGATVAYRQKPFKADVGGYYGGGEFWESTAKCTYDFSAGDMDWQIYLAGNIKKRSNYRYYGFGADPENDSRNMFSPDAVKDFGIYAQQRSRLLLNLSMRPSRELRFSYTGFYQERKLMVPGDEDEANIDRTFDLSLLPGMTRGTETTGRQFYNEIAFRYDTRKYPRQIDPGFRAEGYGGLSRGIRGDESRFLRWGCDLALYLPVIKRNRILVPRIVLDTIHNLNDDLEISFADYPRQPSFRGTNRLSIFRTDDISLIPSLEYQWPVSYNLRGHVFIDYLLVSEAFGDLSFSKAPYAYGFALDLHSVSRELARVTLVNGSEGFRFLFTLGLPRQGGDRTKWE